MYEESWIPKRLPGGGGFSIKNLSLYSLYTEHLQAHNIFTRTNNNYPLMRYLGCKITFYQSLDIDYVCTYSNVLPLKSSMAMYNSMQPSIHLMQQHKVIMPSKNTQKRKKPYTKRFIPPPTQMKSQWYFQHNLCNTPLFMLRTSCLSLDRYYVGSRQKSTNTTIYTINASYIQNRDWGNRDKTWYCQELGTKRYFLYGTVSTQQTISQIKLKQLICLTNTQDYEPGEDYETWKNHHSGSTNTVDAYFKDKLVYGNPFHAEWILGDNTVIHTPHSPTQIKEKLTTNENATLNDLPVPEYIPIQPVIELRYSPYRDKAAKNSCYFIRSHINAHGWDIETHQELINNDLPLWLLLYGYPDYIKRTETYSLLDTNHILVLKSPYTNPKKEPIIPLSYSFVHGFSPYTSIEDKVDEEDLSRWYPCYQFQQEAINNICITGPGTPKIPPGNTCEAKIKYCFYFKWGGDLPPMSTITDPLEQPTYIIPSNINTTNSLQNPATHPATLLYSFDERRGQLTKTATKRMQKDWETQKIPLLFTEQKFAEPTETQETQEETTSEEEEEDNLFQLLNRQRLKQLNLKHRIMKTIKQIQQLE